MKQEDLDKADNICKELTRFNDTLSYLETAKDDFYYFRCSKGMGYIDLEAYITAEERNDIIQRIKQNIKAHRDQKAKDFAAL